MRLTLAIPVLLAVLALEVRADIIHVPADQPTIQAGINAAQDGDTVLVAPGTYTGDGNRDISLWGKAITVKSTSGPEVTIIDVEGDRLHNHRGFKLIHGETHESVIEGFTITGGYVDGQSGGTGPNGRDGGGGIYIRHSSPIIRNCVITGNVSQTDGNKFTFTGRGGAIYINDHSGARIENCILSENKAWVVGGGALVTSVGTSVEFLNCLIVRNEVLNPQGSCGGLYLNGHNRVTGCTIAQNRGNGGAAIHCVVGHTQISGSILWGNIGDYGSEQLRLSDVGQGIVVDVDHSVLEGGLNHVWVPRPAGSGVVELNWDESNTALDPLFMDAEGEDYRLMEGSPGVDAGSFAFPPGTTLDLDGNPRIQNCRADIGAYESPYFADCDENDLPDACQADKGLTPDCNVNGIPDGCELADGVVEDCNRNDMPDECDPDTDEDGLIDDCDNCSLFNPTQIDCQPNGIGDECDLADGTSGDCNENTIPDECDIAAGDSLDLWPPDGDGVPDDCQFDCNGNSIPDADDLAAGTSRDANANHIPDECECPIVGSTPFSGIIDARQPTGIDGLPVGWTTIRLDMCGDAEEIILADQFEITASNDRVAPDISTFVAQQDQVTLSFDSPIPPGAMTIIRHLPSNTHVCMGYLPGDAGGNRKVHELDILQLIDRLNGVQPQTPRLCDIDRSGTCDPLDILRLIDLMNGAGEFEPWLGVDIAPCP